MVDVVLRDGGRFVVRPMTAGDAAVVRAGFESLSAASLRSRFFTPVPRLTSGLVADLTTVEPAHRIVLLAFEARTGQLAGGVRAVRRRDDPFAADVAVTVGDRFQRRGLGAALLRRVRRAALAEGIDRFTGHVLTENAAARALLAAAGATTRFEEPAVLRFDIPLAPVGIASPDGEGRLPAARRSRPGGRRRAA